MAGEMLGDEYELNLDTASTGAGDYDTPTWAKQTSLGDIKFDDGNETPEIPKRIGFKVYKKGRSDFKLSFTMNYNPANTFHKKIRDAIRNGTRVHLGLAEGPIASTDYFHAWCLVTGPTDASLDSGATVEVEAMGHYDCGTDDAEVPAFVEAA
jgi:hypothetical protein